jgi:apolipoprotein N-acyltransferase
VASGMVRPGTIVDGRERSFFRTGFSDRVCSRTGPLSYSSILAVVHHATYGGLPIYLAVPVLFLLSAYMAIYIGLFATLMTRWTKSFWGCLLAVPVFWVSLEYLRGFLFTGFPWSFLGYSQFNQLHIIQISDIFGVYGVSFLMALSNAAFFLVLEITFIQKPSERKKQIFLSERFRR